MKRIGSPKNGTRQIPFVKIILNQPAYSRLTVRKGGGWASIEPQIQFDTATASEYKKTKNQILLYSDIARKTCKIARSTINKYSFQPFSMFIQSCPFSSILSGYLISASFSFIPASPFSSISSTLILFSNQFLSISPLFFCIHQVLF